MWQLSTSGTRRTAERRRVDDGAKTPDHPAGHQPLQPGLGRGLRQADPLGEFRDRQAALLGEDLDDPPIEAVELPDIGPIAVCLAGHAR